MTAFSRVEEKPKTEFVHVEEPEETDPFIELADDIDKAFKKYKDRKLDFSGFGYGYSAEMKAQFLCSLNSIQGCIGKLNNEAIDLWKDQSISNDTVIKELGKMLFYIEVMAMTCNRDLSDVKSECEKLTTAIDRL